MKRYLLIIAAGVRIVTLSTCMDAETGCQEWNAKVDPDIAGKTVVNVSELSDRQVLAAIDCFLKNGADHRAARISGASNEYVSQMLPQATVALASLYYISYLFTKNYQHGDGIALWDDHGVINPPGATEQAYAAYESWFKRVKAHGLAAARNQHLDPLAGTKLRWYGKGR